MPEQTKLSEGSSRWWEFYAVRYAMGTVVGAIVFYVLCLATPLLRPLLFDTAAAVSATTSAGSATAIKLDAVQLSLLATYGLVYCYIASAPILVFHAGRFLLTLRVAGRVWLTPLLLLFTPSIIASIAIWCLASGLSLGERWFYLAAGFLFVLIVWFQYLVAGLTLVKSKELFVFYAGLAKRREEAKGGITDSYRHLREHGNSFFIVLLEILLGVALVGASAVGQTAAPSTSSFDSRLLIYHLVILVIWIVPAASVWVIGTLFEREFMCVDAEPSAAGDAPQAARP